MIDYALSKDRKIGMIQTKESSEDIFNIGCIGKINSFKETSDGRYVINLEGLNLFRIVKEVITEHKFRIYNVEIDNSKHFNLNKLDFDISILLNKFKIFFRNIKSDINFNTIEEINHSDLIKLIAMVCPFTVSEKQMLLESSDISILAKNLIALFDFYINQNDNGKTVN